MNRLPRLPLTTIKQHYARDHQSLAHGQLEYCDFAADRQPRLYALVSEQHAVTDSLVWSAVTQRSQMRSSNAPPTPSVTGYGFTTPLPPFAGCQIWHRCRGSQGEAIAQLDGSFQNISCRPRALRLHDDGQPPFGRQIAILGPALRYAGR